MANFIDAPGQVGQAGALARQPAGESLQTGSFRGEHVTRVRDPVAELEDAAEELTFGQSEKVESKLSKRRIKSGAGVKSFTAKQVEKYLREVSDPDKGRKLRSAAKQLLEKAAGASPEELRRAAREFASDETGSFIALSYAYDRAKSDGADPAVLEALERACEQPDEYQGPVVQTTGRVAAGDGSAAPGSVGMPDSRDVWRDSALDFSGDRQAYDWIVEHHRGKPFPEAVDFLLRTLATDLDAGNRSISKRRLQRLMDDMDQLKTLNTMYGRCDNLLESVRRSYDAVPEDVAAHDLMNHLLLLKERGWQGGDAFAALPDRLGIRGDEPGIYFLQGFKEIVRLVPLKAFDDDPAKRGRVLQAAQEGLDTLIDNELE